MIKIVELNIDSALKMAEDLGKEAKFNVRIYQPDGILYNTEEWNYIKLGLHLMTHAKEIKRVDIRL